MFKRPVQPLMNPIGISGPGMPIGHIPPINPVPQPPVGAPEMPIESVLNGGMARIPMSGRFSRFSRR